jgi:hypothetical protein
MTGPRIRSGSCPDSGATKGLPPNLLPAIKGIANAAVIMSRAIRLSIKPPVSVDRLVCAVVYAVRQHPARQERPQRTRPQAALDV